MTTRGRIISLIAVLALAGIAALLFFFHSMNLPTKAVPFTNVTYSFGPLPSADGASYAVNFETADPSAPLGDDVRVVTIGGLTEGPHVVGKAIAQGTPLSDSAATYFQKDFSVPVTRIGFEVALPPGATQNTAVAMVIADGPVPDNVSDPRTSNFGVHLVITPLQWELGVWPAGGTLDVIAAGVFDARKYAGPLRYEIFRDGSTVRVVQPDGKVAEISDDRIAKFSGNWGVWELFQNGRGTPSPLVGSWWAQ
jgi:hypothetical protein